MRIEQARVSGAIGGFEAAFLAKFGLHRYHSRTHPAIFFGCYRYNGLDIPAVLRHRGLAVIVWGGTDAAGADHAAYRPLLRRRNVRHIAISRSIVEDLERLGLPYYHLPVCPTVVERFKPAPLGRAVYVYSSHRHPQRYGWPTVQAVQRRRGFSPFGAQWRREL